MAARGYVHAQCHGGEGKAGQRHKYVAVEMGTMFRIVIMCGGVVCGDIFSWGTKERISFCWILSVSLKRRTQSRLWNRHDFRSGLTELQILSLKLGK